MNPATLGVIAFSGLNEIVLGQLQCLEDPDWRKVIIHSLAVTEHLDLDSAAPHPLYGICFPVVRDWNLNGLNIVKICGPDRPRDTYQGEHMVLLTSNTQDEISEWRKANLSGSYSEANGDGSIGCWPKG